ncbi:MAG: hypothetical protein RIC35_21495 [Marinoscillum sp.]
MNREPSPKVKIKNLRLIQAGLLSVTLGLAPFVPEPHIWGKLKWLAGGAVGMQPMDWFDVVLHGAPWLFLVWQLFLFSKRNL